MAIVSRVTKNLFLLLPFVHCAMVQTGTPYRVEEYLCATVTTPLTLPDVRNIYVQIQLLSGGIVSSNMGNAFCANAFVPNVRASIFSEITGGRGGSTVLFMPSNTIYSIEVVLESDPPAIAPLYAIASCKNEYHFKCNGDCWIYVQLKGKPKEAVYQYKYQMRATFNNVVRLTHIVCMLWLMNRFELGADVQKFVIIVATVVLWRHS